MRLIEPCRDMFRKAVGKVMDPEVLCPAWVQFEMSEGSSETLEFATSKLQAVQVNVNRVLVLN